MSCLFDRLHGFGAVPNECVDLRDRSDPRLLRYADLARKKAEPLVDGVVEQQARALLYVVDTARLQGDAALQIDALQRTLAMRGDLAWLGILHPGRLDIYATNLLPDPDAEPAQYASDSAAAAALLPRLAQGEEPVPAASLSLRDQLLNLMTDAAEELRRFGLSAHETIALTGRVLFFRYLKGRQIITDAHLPRIAPAAASLEACFADARSLAETNRWLDDTFNGDLLALPNADYLRYFGELLRQYGSGITRPLNAIMALDTAVTPGASQRRLDWGDLEFNHLPVGLLSETYEELMYRLDSEARRDTSVYYTPSHIAEYMVEEALHAHPAGASARVLDPACGAGVFLVTCFRKLAELRFHEDDKWPDRQALRDILNRQLTGFDTNAHARTLAALGLYLTALELDPDPAPVEDLRFNKLDDVVLIDVADPDSPHDIIVPMAGSLGEHVPERFRDVFDLVIGNPPWTSLTRKYADIDRRFTARCRAVATRRGLDAIARNYQNPDRIPDLPFVWGAMDWAKPDGRIALALAGRWLFKQSQKGIAARKALLSALAITGILNGASLRQTRVWPNVDQPFCLLFADNRVPEEDDRFVFVSPEFEPNLSDKGRMRIDANDALPVAIATARGEPVALKALYRGTPLDLSIVSRVRSATDYTVGEYWNVNRGLRHGQGYQVAKRTRDDTFLRGKPTLTADYSAHPFRVVDGLTPYIPRGLEWPRSPDIYNAPLLLVREGSRADRTRGRALVSDADLAYSESYYGYSAVGVSDGAFLVRYLLILVHSDLFEYLTLMTSAKFGVEREALQALDINRFPFVPPERLSREQRKAVAQSAERLLANHPDWNSLARTVAEIYDLTERDQQTIADTLATRAPFPSARKRAQQSVSDEEASEFCAQVEAELAPAFEAGGYRVRVGPVESAGANLPWRFIGLALEGRPLPVSLPTRWLENINDLATSRITILDAREPSLTIGLLDRYRYWTPTQVRLLASDLVWQYGAQLEERAST